MQLHLIECVVTHVSDKDHFLFLLIPSRRHITTHTQKEKPDLGYDHGHPISQHTSCIRLMYSFRLWIF